MVMVFRSFTRSLFNRKTRSRVVVRTRGLRREKKRRTLEGNTNEGKSRGRARTSSQRAPVVQWRRRRRGRCEHENGSERNSDSAEPQRNKGGAHLLASSL